MKNKLNLLMLFGLIYFAAGVFCLSILAQEMFDRYRFNLAASTIYNSTEMIILMTCCIGFFSTAIGLFLKKRWARILGAIILLGLACMWFIVVSTSYSENNWIPLFGFSVVVVAGVIFGIFFLNNEFVVDQGKLQEERPIEHNDILDV
ncbi:MAG: hypothetical protein AAFO07_13495 [Bacteroidota bacterium]